MDDQDVPLASILPNAIRKNTATIGQYREIYEARLPLVYQIKLLGSIMLTFVLYLALEFDNIIYGDFQIYRWFLDHRHQHNILYPFNNTNILIVNPEDIFNQSAWGYVLMESQCKGLSMPWNAKAIAGIFEINAIALLILYFFLSKSFYDAIDEKDDERDAKTTAKLGWVPYVFIILLPGLLGLACAIFLIALPIISPYCYTIKNIVTGALFFLLISGAISAHQLVKIPSLCKRS